MHVGTLDTKTYPYIGDQPRRKVAVAQKVGGGKTLSRFADDSNNARIFTFIAGGMSHHEIVSIENL